MDVQSAQSEGAGTNSEESEEAKTKEHQVLVVAGSEESEFLRYALTHPDFDVLAASKEQAVVDALTTQPFSLVVVAGQIGRRGPLMICEAVRARQPDVPLLLCIGDETAPLLLKEHQRRKMPNVGYMEVRGGVLKSHHVPTGVQVRKHALDLFSVGEDAATSKSWPQEFAAANAPEEEAAADNAPAEAAPATPPPQQPQAPAGGAAPAAPPPLLTEANEDDREFAKRIVERTRTTDFRSPMPELKLDHIELSERKAVQLRDQIKRLERDLARTAFVYAARTKGFEEAEELKSEVEKLRVEREEVEKLTAQKIEAATAKHREELAVLQKQSEETVGGANDQVAGLQQTIDRITEERERLRERVGELNADVQELNLEIEKLEGQAAGEKTELEKKQAEAADELKKSRDELMAIRVELEAKISSLETERDLRVKDMDGLRDELKQVQADLESERKNSGALEERLQLLQEGRDEQLGVMDEVKRDKSSLRDELDKTKDKLDQAHRDQAEALAKAEEERAAVQVKLDQHQEKAEEERNKLQTKLEEERATLQSKHEEELEQLRAQNAEHEKTLNDKIDALKESATAFREAHQDKDEVRQKQSEELAALKAKIKEQKELKSTEKALKSIEERLERQAHLLGRVEQGVAMGPGEAKVLSGTDVLRWIAAKPARLLVLVIVCAVALTLMILPWMVRGPAPAPAAAPAVPAPTARVEPPAAPAADIGEPVADAPTPEDSEPTEPEGTDESEPEEPATEEAATAEPEDPEPADPATDAPKEPVAAAAAPVDEGPKSEEERKNLRRELMALYRKRDYKGAAAAGTKLQTKYRLDWEAHFKFAEALRKAGDKAGAKAAYESFIKEYPTNDYSTKAKKQLEKL